MKILVACEYSGIVSNAFDRKGHDVTSCDLEPSEFKKHYQGSVFDLLYSERWDMMICFPPCTYLTWANTKTDPQKRTEAGEFALKLWNAPIEKIALENPRGYLTYLIRTSDQELHPYHFGDYYYKRTQLWLKNLPPLIYQCSGIDKQPEKTWVNKKGQTKYMRDMGFRRSGKERSKFHLGMADAMAQQWG